MLALLNNTLPVLPAIRLFYEMEVRQVRSSSAHFYFILSSNWYLIFDYEVLIFFCIRCRHILMSYV